MIPRGRALFAYALTIIAVAAAAWALYDPRPYWLVVGLLALLPWLALVTTARGRKPDLHVPLMLPGCVLGLRAVIDVQLLERWQPLLPAAAIAFVMAVLIRLTREDREFPLWLYLLLFVPVMSFYGYGSVVLANKLLDRSSPKLYLTFVYDRSMHKVSRQMVWDLRLGPWGHARRPRAYRCRADSTRRRRSTMASACCSTPAPSAFAGSRSRNAAEVR